MITEEKRSASGFSCKAAFSLLSMCFSQLFHLLPFFVTLCLPYLSFFNRLVLRLSKVAYLLCLLLMTYLLPSPAHFGKLLKLPKPYRRQKGLMWAPSIIAFSHLCQCLVIPLDMSTTKSMYPPPPLNSKGYVTVCLVWF